MSELTIQAVLHINHPVGSASRRTWLWPLGTPLWLAIGVFVQSTTLGMATDGLFDGGLCQRSNFRTTRGKSRQPGTSLSIGICDKLSKVCKNVLMTIIPQSGSELQNRYAKYSHHYDRRKEEDKSTNTDTSLGSARSIMRRDA
ncbi:uncharacterized protein ATNIH1004_001993 [Aspergillus tanneri]|uniref:Uncharacterized protein n=1 Tax=Aspergillus tanneri TaxID=1220188 RepID=A0A5M9M2W8_9EURO|nr:uncharacterized protein ATNIH1004_001993 [Aspergillus tanneri]KAA8641325.1 hypothetical protein ATNIH1004_001993 [Aspergillus tanneri]